MPLRPIATRYLGSPRRTGGLQFLTAPSSEPPAEPITHSTTFATDTIGQPPVGWSDKYVATTWPIVADATAASGQLVRVTTGNTSRRALGWDATAAQPEANADMDVVGRVKTSSISIQTTGPGIVVRGQGAAGTETCYMLGLYNSTSARLYSYAGGTSALIGSITLTVAADAYVWLRLRCEGAEIRAKAWTGTEPGAWDIESLSNTAVTGNGWPGFYVARNATASFDQMSVTYL